MGVFMSKKTQQVQKKSLFEDMEHLKKGKKGFMFKIVKKNPTCPLSTRKKLV